MISQTSRHALNILGFLVREEGVRTPGETIARHTGVPANYLSKILNQLRKQGVVEAEKGWGGGFQIRPEALERPIRDILTIFDGTAGAEPTECVFGLKECDANNPCPLHLYWEQIKRIQGEMVSQVTIRHLGGTTV